MPRLFKVILDLNLCVLLKSAQVGDLEAVPFDLLARGSLEMSLRVSGWWRPTKGWQSPDQVTVAATFFNEAKYLSEKCPLLDKMVRQRGQISPTHPMGAQ